MKPGENPAISIQTISAGFTIASLKGIMRGQSDARWAITFMLRGSNMPEDRKPKPAVSHDNGSLLRLHPLFRGLAADALDRLAGFARKRTFKRGASIFAKGDPGGSLFFIVSGVVKIGVSSADGRGAVFNFINAHEVFGEIALLDGLERTADASANTDCELLIFDRRHFIPFLQEQPLLATKLIELLCARIRWISDHVEQVIFPELPTRLAKALLRLAERQAASASPRLSITQQEISEMVGMSRESINKQLQEWVEQKLVQVQRGAITLIDLKSLKDLADRSAT